MERSESFSLEWKRISESSCSIVPSHRVTIVNFVDRTSYGRARWNNGTLLLSFVWEGGFLAVPSAFHYDGTMERDGLSPVPL
jgi:hypothetical protein